MASNCNWTKKLSELFFFIIITIPFWIIFSPFYIILKTIATALQPYLFKIQRKTWNKRYQECLKKGIHIDYPPSYGTFLGIAPWGKKEFNDLDDLDDFYD